MNRYNFIKEGIGSPWYQLEESRAWAAARKYFKCPIPLWKFLKSQGKIRKQIQKLDNGIWKKI